MIFENQSELKDRIELLTNRKVTGKVPITEDTTEYLRIDRGMVLRLDGNDYLVTGDAREGRFGINEQPKFWVKYAIDLSTGERKVIKLVFYEEFTRRIGRFLLKCFRSPEKESAILEAVRGNPYFMQGKTVQDAKHNNVRIIDFITGATLFSTVFDIPQDHDVYLFQTFPRILESILASIRAMGLLTEKGQHHGDIRNDHILIQRGTGQYCWIDFDYAVNYPDYDLWSIGNILVYAAGKGIHPVKSVMKNEARYPIKVSHLAKDDSMVFYPYRVANLRALYPYIPKKLNDVLMNFSCGTRRFYENYETLAEDVEEVLTLF
jgi:hypothetical protein